MSIRLRQICLVAEKLAPVVEDLKSVLGLEVCFKDPEVGVFGLENSLFPVGNNFIEVVAPIKENTAAGRYLKRRNGDGGYMVICQCDTHETQLARKAQAASLNVRVVLEHENKAFHVMQLHPADTGGAFFEIDWDAKQEPEGNWMPAGGSGWTGAKRNDVVERVYRGRIAVGRPQRPGRALEQYRGNQLRNDSRGRLELPFDNAAVRFVEVADGRGEGLGGVDIVPTDKKRLLAEADRRGRRTGDDQVTICGTRFYLVQP